MLRELITVNPRPGKKSKRKGGKKHKVVYRRNPRMPAAVKGFVDQLVPAGIGGAGALAIDIALGNIPQLPVEWKAGWKRTALRTGLAVALGFGLRYVPMIKKATADQITAGALTVIAYDSIKSAVQQNFPQLTLGAYSGDLSAYSRAGYGSLPAIERLQGSEMSAYVPSGSAYATPGMIPPVQ